MSRKGWTKMDDFSWRHDGFDISNKLNVFTDTDQHASEASGSSYELIYTVNNSETGPIGSHTLESGINSKDEARRLATKVMEQHPDTIPV